MKTATINEENAGNARGESDLVEGDEDANGRTMYQWSVKGR